MRARTIIAAAAIALAVLVAGSQLIVPPLGEGEIEDRLTQGGGSAEASLSAFPAARLLWGDGDRIAVRGSQLELELTEDQRVFERLDGFGEVEVALSDFRAGPFAVSGFELRREGAAPYSLRSSSSTTPADIVGSGADALGLAGGPILGYIAGQVPMGDREIPIELDMEMESDDGRIRIVEGGGTVDGFRTDALAQFITAAIVVQL